MPKLKRQNKSALNKKPEEWRLTVHLRILDSSTEEHEDIRLQQLWVDENSGECIWQDVEVVKTTPEQEQ